MIKETVHDKLILTKLHFFKCIASELQPFLANYQTDKPMVCFLETDLSSLLRALMRRFIKDDVLSEATTVEKLMVVDVEKSNHKSYKKIEVGFCAENALKDACAKLKKWDAPYVTNIFCLSGFNVRASSLQLRRT